MNSLNDIYVNTVSMKHIVNVVLNYLECEKEQLHNLDKRFLEIKLKICKRYIETLPNIENQRNEWKNKDLFKSNRNKLSKINDNIDDIKRIYEQISFLIKNIGEFSPKIRKNIRIKNPEEQFQYAFLKLVETIQILGSKSGYHPLVINECLFYHWIQTISIRNSNKRSSINMEDLPIFMQKVDKKIREIGKNFKGEFIFDRKNVIKILHTCVKITKKMKLSTDDKKIEMDEVSHLLAAFLNKLCREKISFDALETSLFILWRSRYNDYEYSIFSQLKEDFYDPIFLQEISSYGASLIMPVSLSPER